jgi:hypothetical protein
MSRNRYTIPFSTTCCLIFGFFFIAACGDTMRSEPTLALAAIKADSSSKSPVPSALPPVLFFSDLTSGPNSGNSDASLGQTPGQDGALVTIWGAHLGTKADSQLFCNSVPAARIYSWSQPDSNSYQKITFQVSHLSTTGINNIIIKSNGLISNPLPFEVRKGRILFASAQGSDKNPGSYSRPFQTLLKSRDASLPGDIVYVLDGVQQKQDDGEGWDSAFTLRGRWCSSEGFPRAFIAYPGATVTIGSDDRTNPAVGLRSTDFSSGDPCSGNWVFSGIRFRGIGPVALSGPSSNWRFVGNDISCPRSSGSDGGACFATMLASNVKFYGNIVHDAGVVNASALFHGVYFSTESNHIDMGWNTVARVRGCRGVQVHSSPLGSNYPNSGYDLYDISIHDNLIHDTQCDGIILDTIDPSKGKIEVFNNVIYNAGQGPNNPEKTGGWSCINIRGTTENGEFIGGTVDIYNNTLYACGTFANPPYGNANAGIFAGGSQGLSVRLRNNLLYMVATISFPTGVPYLLVWNPEKQNLCRQDENCTRVHGANNLFFGSGPLKINSANFSNSRTENPMLRDIGKPDLHLSVRSPAARAGTETPELMDHDGIPVGHGVGFPIGAYAVLGSL